MQEEIKKAWNKFKKTGKITDQLEYKKVIQKSNGIKDNNQ